MAKHTHNRADFPEPDGRLNGLAEEALANLRQGSLDPSEVSRFLRVTAETCSLLQDRKEALTMAKVGLEAILSAYDSRFGERTAPHHDITLFQSILAEKEDLLEGVEADLQKQAGELEEFLEKLEERRTGLERNLNLFEAEFKRVRDAYRTEERRLEADRAKIEAVRERFWPRNGDSPGEPERINLPKETLHQLVDDVFDRMTSDRKTRSELIGQVLTSIRDEDLRAVLSQKIVPSLDDLPEVSDDEFWDG